MTRRLLPLASAAAIVAGVGLVLGLGAALIVAGGFGLAFTFNVELADAIARQTAPEEPAE